MGDAREQQVLEKDGSPLKVHLLEVPMRRCTSSLCGVGAVNIDILQPVYKVAEAMFKAVAEGREPTEVAIDPRVAELVS